MEQQVREVSSVVYDDVSGSETLQVTDGAEPLILVGDVVEIEGQPGLELVEATE